MQWKALSLLGLCMCAVWVPKAAGQGEVEDEDEYEEEERASLLIRHALLAKEPTQGNNLSVLVEIFNAGSAAATDVTLQAPEWGSGFDVEGLTSAVTWESIQPDDSVRLEYSVVPKVAGVQPPKKVMITYKPDADSKTTGYGATPYMSIMTTYQKWMNDLLKVGTYASLGLARTSEQWRNYGIAAGAALLLTSGYWMYRRLEDVRVRHNRAKNLAYFNKDE
eukprot:jgi/Astpho2/5262/Aster-x0671